MQDGLHRYAKRIDEFPDDAFDLVLLDGEDRDSCIRAAARKVQCGGFVVLDNADYEFDTAALNGDEQRSTFNGVWRTDICIRPLRDHCPNP
jgi:predicted O-methyltransferase YrrM